MRRAIPLMLILILLAVAILLIVSSVIAMKIPPSPFLIAAAIVSFVALFGAVFSLYTEKRSRKRTPQENFYRPRPRR
ncbi:MAG: hypothetical protein ACQCN4_08480 [Candidatus Bathyarchaeia archaeon]